MLGNDVSRSSILLLGLPRLHAHVHTNQRYMGQIHH